MVGSDYAADHDSSDDEINDESKLTNNEDLSSQKTDTCSNKIKRIIYPLLMWDETQRKTFKEVFNA